MASPQNFSRFADTFFPGIPLTSVDMKTTIKTPLGAGLSLLATFGLNHSANNQIVTRTLNARDSTGIAAL